MQRLRKEWKAPPLALLSAALPTGWEGEQVLAYAEAIETQGGGLEEQSPEAMEASFEATDRAMENLMGAARRVLFFPSREDMTHYPKLLAISPGSRFSLSLSDFLALSLSLSLALSLSLSVSLSLCLSLSLSLSDSL